MDIKQTLDALIAGDKTLDEITPLSKRAKYKGKWQGFDAPPSNEYSYGQSISNAFPLINGLSLKYKKFLDQTGQDRLEIQNFLKKSSGLSGQTKKGLNEALKQLEAARHNIDMMLRALNKSA